MIQIKSPHTFSLVPIGSTPGCRDYGIWRSGQDPILCVLCVCYHQNCRVPSHLDDATLSEASENGPAKTMRGGERRRSAPNPKYKTRLDISRPDATQPAWPRHRGFGRCSAYRCPSQAPQAQLAVPHEKKLVASIEAEGTQEAGSTTPATTGRASGVPPSVCRPR